MILWFSGFSIPYLEDRNSERSFSAGSQSIDGSHPSLPFRLLFVLFLTTLNKRRSRAVRSHRSRVQSFLSVPPLATTPPNQLPLALIFKLARFDEVHWLTAAATAASSSRGTRIQTLAPSVFKMSTGMAVPVKPRYCCKAAVRYERAVMSSRFGEVCGERVFRTRWKYAYGGFRRVNVVVVVGLAWMAFAVVIVDSQPVLPHDTYGRFDITLRNASYWRGDEYPKIIEKVKKSSP